MILVSPRRSLVLCAQESLTRSETDPRLCIVFVVDVSTSMYDIMDSLKQALADYVRESKPGDSISIVTFGTSSKLLFRGRINTAADVERMLEFCKTLAPTDEHTYITSGFNAGVSELYQFYKDDPSRTHIIVFMSDGRNNPPPHIAEDDVLKYDDIKERYFTRFEPGKDWFITYVFLKETRDPTLADFVQRVCRGNAVPLARPQAEAGPGMPSPPSISVAEVLPGPGLSVDENDTILLGSAWLPTKLKIPLQIRRLRGALEGQALAVKPILDGLATTKQLLAEVKPSEIACGPMQTTAEIMLSISGIWDKGISGALLFEPAGDSIVMVHPPQLRFKFDKPPKITIGRYSPELGGKDGNGGISPDWLSLGSLWPGEAPIEKTLILELDGSDPPPGLKILAVPDIGLPEGVTCTAEVDLQGLFRLSKGAVTVTVKADETADLPRETQYTGNLKLTSPNFSLVFSQGGLIPLKVFTARHTDAPPRGVNRPPPSNPIDLPVEQIAAAIGAVALLVFLVFLLRAWLIRRYLKKFVPMEGWLVVLEHPENSEAKNTDMGAFSNQQKKDTLVIGSDPASDIHLDHKSVDKRHAEIQSGREGTPVPIYIKYLGVNDVKVNGFLIDREVKLEDRDIIDIGQFQFLYSNSHLKQVVVHYRNGDVRYGVPLTWAIEEEGFMLRPEGEGAEDLQVYVRFEKLKGVFFVKDFDKEIARKIKHSSMFAEKDHVLIEFTDGEKLEGCTIKDYDPKALRFFVVPKAEPGKEETNTCILVERQFFKSIKVLGKVPA